MKTTISAKGSSEAYEAPRITVLGTVTELTEWCVFGKSLRHSGLLRSRPDHQLLELTFGLAAERDPRVGRMLVDDPQAGELHLAERRGRCSGLLPRPIEPPARGWRGMRRSAACGRQPKAVRPDLGSTQKASFPQKSLHSPP